MRAALAVAVVTGLSAQLQGLCVEAAEPVKMLRVAAVQMRSSRNLEENIATTKRHLAECAKQGARVVVFPECSLSGYFDDDYMKALAQSQLEDAERQVGMTRCSVPSRYAYRTARRIMRRNT